MLVIIIIVFFLSRDTGFVLLTLDEKIAAMAGVVELLCADLDEARSALEKTSYVNREASSLINALEQSMTERLGNNADKFSYMAKQITVD